MTMRNLTPADVDRLAADPEHAIAMFPGLGSTGEALLHHHIRVRQAMLATWRCWHTASTMRAATPPVSRCPSTAAS